MTATSPPTYQSLNENAKVPILVTEARPYLPEIFWRQNPKSSRLSIDSEIKCLTVVALNLNKSKNIGKGHLKVRLNVCSNSSEVILIKIYTTILAMQAQNIWQQFKFRFKILSS